MRILGIDTSCDETSAAITDGCRIRSNVVSSQVRYHKKYGGVVPFLAKRLHAERIDAVIALALNRSGISWDEVDALAVTYGPGLAPALEIGVEKAKELAVEKKLPLYAVNHMAGHVASCYAQTGNRKRPPVDCPALAVLVSGGHSELVMVEAFGSFRLIGQTVDDALGEAYDKVAKMLGLGYPGGKIISGLAKEGNPEAYPLPIPMLRSQDLNLSYSGLKNAVRLTVERIGAAPTRQAIADLAASFEMVAQESLVFKIRKALVEYPETRSIVLAGGVAANVALRQRLRRLAKEYGLALLVPATYSLCTDNAAMIGVAAYLGIGAGQQPADVESLDRKPGLSW